jgi:hypothetical protein
VADRARDRGGLGCLGQHGDTAGTDDAAPWGACKGQRGRAGSGGSADGRSRREGSANDRVHTGL